MPWIIDYDAVLEQTRGQQLRSLYPMSGAFGFAEGAPTHVRGWIGPDDPTIRPAARAFVRGVPAPYEQTLTDWFIRTWQDHLPGKMWLLPMSHWHYELNFGSCPWLAATLDRIGLDPGQLQDRNNGSAIEFAPDEHEPARLIIHRLLEMLLGSDFAVLFPGRDTLCTLHHHKQLWWVTANPTFATTLDTIT